ncbi:MAG: creatininase family protein [Chloroflexi bacterium]|nr:creatininase family protein [Chloroflexota bacterium]
MCGDQHQPSVNDRDLFFANLSWPRVADLLRSARPTVLLLPVGTVEPHGPHAPLSTDVLISLGICRRVARRLQTDPAMGALILPPIGYGVTRYGAGFPGAIHIAEETLQALVVDVCASLIRQGFPYVMVVNNHFEPEQVQTLHRSLDAVQARTGAAVGYLDLTRRERAAVLTEEFRRAECHAGRYETSLVIADEPDLVDATILPSLPAVPIDLAKAIGRGHRDFLEMGLTQAYNGAPAEATAAEGESTYAVLADLLMALMRDLVQGTGGRDRPRAAPPSEKDAERAPKRRGSCPAGPIDTRSG